MTEHLVEMVPVAEAWAVLRAMVLVAACWAVAEFGTWCRQRAQESRHPCRWCKRPTRP